MQIVTPEVLTASWQVFVLSKLGHGWLGLARIGQGWPSAAVRKEPAHRQSCLEAVSAGGRNKQQSAASSWRSFSHLLETSRQTEICHFLYLHAIELRSIHIFHYSKPFSIIPQTVNDDFRSNRMVQAIYESEPEIVNLLFLFFHFHDNHRCKQRC